MHSGIHNMGNDISQRWALLCLSLISPLLFATSDIQAVMGAFATATAAASQVGVAAAQADAAKFEAAENSHTAQVTTAINAAEKAHESDNNLELGKFDALTKLRIESKKAEKEIEMNHETVAAQNYSTALHYQSQHEQLMYEYKYKFQELAMQYENSKQERALKALTQQAELVKNGLSTGLTRVGEAIGVNKVFRPQTTDHLTIASVGAGASSVGKSLMSMAGRPGGAVKTTSPARSFSPVPGKSGSEIRSLGESFASIFRSGTASGSTPGNHKRSDLESFQQRMEQNQRAAVDTAIPHQSRAARELARQPEASTHTANR